MSDFIERALSAKRESKHVEFKVGFDPASPADWVEITKDIVAIANSGGGVIVFGLDSAGSPVESSLGPLAKTDPADFANKISKYTGATIPEFEIKELGKLGQNLLAFTIRPASIPIVFQKPGTYDIGGGKQKTAFGVGTVYFRHGAKSEPGNSDDIRAAVDRQLDSIRKSWLRNVRKVVQAPQGSQIITVRPAGRGGGSVPSATIHSVRDPNATPVLLTRDSKKASGVFVHESVSEGIFDEINNVIDANRVLARGQRRFFLGQQIYYRIYAERDYVLKRKDDFVVLLYSGLCDLYSPALFWISGLSDSAVGEIFAEMYLHPKSPFIHALLRLAVLLGRDFCDWLHARWHDKWKRHPQPPMFYFTFKQMMADLETANPCSAALRLGANSELQIDSLPVRVEDLIQNPQRSAALLSSVCMRVFERNDPELRSTARHLDLLAFAPDIQSRKSGIARAVRKAVGDREPGDLSAPAEDE